MSRIGIYEVSELRREMEIGCAEDEHGVRQAVVLSLRASLSHEHLFAGDSYTPPYDYCELVQAVDDALASRPRFVLQETVFVAIAARVLANPVVQSVEIHMAKTERYEGCRWIGVQALMDREAMKALAPRFMEDPAVAALA